MLRPRYRWRNVVTYNDNSSGEKPALAGNRGYNYGSHRRNNRPKARHDRRGDEAQADVKQVDTLHLAPRSEVHERLCRPANDGCLIYA